MNTKELIEFTDKDIEKWEKIFHENMDNPELCTLAMRMLNSLTSLYISLLRLQATEEG